MVNQEVLKKVIVEQRGQFLEVANPIQRDVLLGSDFEKISRLKEAVIITGVRRSGKSYLLKMIWQKISADLKNGNGDFLYINFEDERLLKFEAVDFENLLEAYYELFPAAGKKLFLFFDEIQIIAGWEKFINRLIREEKSKIFITGSNAALLSREIGTALTGRVYPLALFPLSFGELARYRLGHGLSAADLYKPAVIASAKKIFGQYLENGGFPEVVLQNFRPLLQEYLKNIIYRDIVLRYKIKHEASLREIVAFVISNIGMSASLENIARMTKMKNLMTVKNYLSYLENSFLFYRISKYSHSVKKQIYNPDKFYCVDSGFYNEIAFTNSANRGRVLENLVYMELKRRDKEIFYFQGKRECDFLIRGKNKITAAIQVTVFLNENDKEREIGGLIEAMDRYVINEGLILTENESDSIERDGKIITIKPIWRWCLGEQGKK
ncbi:MAG: ATP-binding protein [Candidatus Paceibacterota bacterium]